VGAYDTIADKQDALIRKGLQGSVFVADYSAAAITSATLFDATSGDLKSPLVTGYKDVGWTDSNGAKFARSLKTAEMTSWGSVDPTRSDTTADTTTIDVTCQEANLVTIGLYTGAAKSSITTTATANGVVTIQKPAVGSTQYYRLLAVAVDENDTGEIVIARFLPRCKVTNYGDQSYDAGDAGIVWNVTMTAYEDDTLGFSEEFYFGGAGWKALLTDMGFTLGP
jgi:hypothetical protein